MIDSMFDTVKAKVTLKELIDKFDLWGQLAAEVPPNGKTKRTVKRWFEPDHYGMPFSLLQICSQTPQRKAAMTELSQEFIRDLKPEADVDVWFLSYKYKLRTDEPLAAARAVALLGELRDVVDDMPGTRSWLKESLDDRLLVLDMRLPYKPVYIPFGEDLLGWRYGAPDGYVDEVSGLNHGDLMEKTFSAMHGRSLADWATDMARVADLDQPLRSVRRRPNPNYQLTFDN